MNIDFRDYNRISDTLMYLDNTHIFKFCVNLSYRDKDKNSRNYHSEFKYYLNGETKYSITRRFGFYFLIDSKEYFDDNIMLFPKNMMPLIFLLKNKIMPWYTGNKLFKVVEGQLKIVGKFQSQVFVVDQRKSLQFDPIVCNYNDGDDYGLRITINGVNNFIDMNLDTFLEFYYYITRLDMYNAALNMINYVKEGPHGINLVDMTGNKGYNSYQNKQQGNFFDNIK